MPPCVREVAPQNPFCSYEVPYCCITSHRATDSAASLSVIEFIYDPTVRSKDVLPRHAIGRTSVRFAPPRNDQEKYHVKQVESLSSYRYLGVLGNKGSYLSVTTPYRKLAHCHHLSSLHLAFALYAVPFSTSQHCPVCLGI